LNDKTAGIHYALDRAMANRADPVTRSYLHEELQRHLKAD